MRIECLQYSSEYQLYPESLDFLTGILKFIVLENPKH